ncbi:MAG: DedA family protein [Peptostreptococcaceae bacterium]
MDLELIIKEFMLNYGVLSIFLIVALEYANLPLPSEIVLPFVGIMAVEYDMNIYMVIILSVVGGIVGSLTNYYIGYKYGNPLLFKLKEKYPKTQNAIRESNNIMEKYDKISVMFSRLIPLLRTMISIVAGVNKMNIYSFISYSSIGIAVWNTFLITVGYFVGDNMHKIHSILTSYTKSSIIVLLILVIFVVCIWQLKKIKKKPTDEELINTNEIDEKK